MILLFAFSDWKRQKELTAIFYSVQLEDSYCNRPLLTFKGMLSS